MKICTRCGAGILEPNKPWIHRGKIVCRRCFETLSTKQAHAVQANPAPSDNPYAANAIPAQPNSALPPRNTADRATSYPPDSVRPLNGYGLAGLIISVMGIFTAGLVSPFGLVMSIVGLRTRPRGMAIIGLILSTLGTANLIRWIVFTAMAWHQIHHGW